MASTVANATEAQQKATYEAQRTHLPNLPQWQEPCLGESKTQAAARHRRALLPCTERSDVERATRHPSPCMARAQPEAKAIARKLGFGLVTMDKIPNPNTGKTTGLTITCALEKSPTQEQAKCIIDCINEGLSARSPTRSRAYHHQMANTNMLVICFYTHLEAEKAIKILAELQGKPLKFCARTFKDGDIKPVLALYPQYFAHGSYYLRKMPGNKWQLLVQDLYMLYTPCKIVMAYMEDVWSFWDSPSKTRCWFSNEKEKLLAVVAALTEVGGASCLTEIERPTVGASGSGSAIVDLDSEDDSGLGI